MADRYWGNRKSIIIGGFLMAIGQFLMFASGALYEQTGLAATIMYSGLAFLIFGNGFFKPNISTMVGQLYPQGDKRVDAAFTIFYMGINLGAFLSPLICGTLGDTGNPADFKWGFLAAGIGMMLSTLLFIWLKDHYIVTPEGEPIGAAPNKSRKADTLPINTAAEVKKDFSTQQIATWAGIELGLFALFYFLDFGVIGSFIFSLTIAAPGFIISDKSLSKEERERIWVIYIIAFFVIFFWAAFEQAGASLTYFAEEQTDRSINMTLSKVFLYGLIALVVGTLGWLLSKVMSGFKNEQKGVKELFVLLLAGGIAYGVYSFFQIPEAGIFIETIPTSFFQSINAIAIVLFAPLFAMLWTGLGNRNLEPASPYKQAIGLFLLAVGYAVIAIGVKDVTSKVSMMWLVSLYTIHTFGELCLSPIGLSMVNKLAPVKFASLLMGVWFLSTSAANKFAGVLSGLYPENGVTKGFIGFQITDLYDFFMIFVFMAGAAAIILFLLSNRLLKLMHGVR
jgi:POT family proton-dependent oligopeptide transporter